MFRILLWAAAIFAAFYNSLLYKSMPLALLGSAEAVLSVLACLFLIYRARTLRCCIQIPITAAECGRPLTVRFCVENRSFLSCARLMYCLEQSSHFLKKTKKKWIHGAVAVPGENHYDYAVIIKDYGSYELNLAKIRIYDLTGLFYIHKKVQSSGSVQVLPQLQEVRIHLTEAARNFFGDSDIYDDFRPGHDRSELFQIRPFQKGDKIQSIHWKLSAKTDELLVKEDSLPKACPAVLFLDYQQGKQKKAKKVNIYLVVLASISFSLMDAGCSHYAAWYSSICKDIIRVRVDDEESLYLFLCAYLEETFQEKSGNLLEAYQEKYPGERCLCRLVLDETLTLCKNGEKIEEFTVKNWKEKLGGLNIIL